MEKKSFSMGGGIVGGAKGAVGGCCGGKERKRQMGMGGDQGGIYTVKSGYKVLENHCLVNEDVL